MEELRRLIHFAVGERQVASLDLGRLLEEVSELGYGLVLHGGLLWSFGTIFKVGVLFALNSQDLRSIHRVGRGARSGARL